jgi:phenylalanine-4-hydroxylase
MQPQLFVTPNFQNLTDVLEEFVDTMALRTGGLSGIQKAICSENIGCCEYDSGLQVSGVFTNVISLNNQAIYLQTTGPTSLSYNNQEIKGHGKSYHKDGFGSPIGKIKNISEAFELLTDDELDRKGIKTNIICKLEFESGIKVKGLLKNIYRHDCKILLLSFEECTVQFQDQILFKPEWGIYDMAIGQEIITAFNGHADPKNFGYFFPVPQEKTHKVNHSKKARKVHSLYQSVRDIREQKTTTDLQIIFNEAKKLCPDEWLLFLELSEIISTKPDIDSTLKEEIKSQLSSYKNNGSAIKTLIEDGLRIKKF